MTPPRYCVEVRFPAYGWLPVSVHWTEEEARIAFNHWKWDTESFPLDVILKRAIGEQLWEILDRREHAR